jgi:hypothetical protein
MQLKKSLLYILLSLPFTFAQNSDANGFEFLPGGMNFMPLKANHQEAKVGVLYHTATANLKVDIGNNIDLFGYNFENGESRLTAAIEFMAYALSTSFNGNRLQIDAVDGFFGGNISFSRQLINGSTEQPDKFLARLRIIHNSAHFVDGHYDQSKNEWIDKLSPIPYTEDFGELTVAHQLNSASTAFRYFGGFSYSTLVRPDNIKRYNFHTGFEFALKKIIGKVASKDVNPFVAAYITTDGADSYIISQQTMAGVKFGNWDSKGILLYLSYYSGGDIFGSYFKRRISNFGIGFSVDFP